MNQGKSCRPMQPQLLLNIKILQPKKTTPEATKTEHPNTGRHQATSTHDGEGDGEKMIPLLKNGNDEKETLKLRRRQRQLLSSARETKTRNSPRRSQSRRRCPSSACRSRSRRTREMREPRNGDGEMEGRPFREQRRK
ncbi:hypothetical protein Dimus_039137 [Dionaea muscipula]